MGRYLARNKTAGGRVRYTEEIILPVSVTLFSASGTNSKGRCSLQMPLSLSSLSSTSGGCIFHDVLLLTHIPIYATYIKDMEIQENHVNRKWQVFDEGPVQAISGLYASMNSQAQIVIDRLAFEELKSLAAVILLFDSANDSIGIKPASPLMPNAFEVKVKNGSGHRVIFAFPFAKRHEMKLDGTVRFRNVVVEDGILVLSLRHLENASRKKQNLRKKR